MFGLARKEDVEALEAKFEALRKAIAAQSKDLSTKLYTVEVLQGGKPFRTYRDVVCIEDSNNYTRSGVIMFGVVSSLILKTRNGDVILRGEGYTYISTEQKAEPEVKSVKLVDTLALSYRLEGLVDEMVKLQSYADELNHRIEMLELRLNGAEKKAKPKTRN